MARRPAALPAQVEPFPDWTLLVHLHIRGPSPHLQGTGGCQRCQTVEVKGQHVLTCTVRRIVVGFKIGLHHTEAVTLCYKTCGVLNGFISGAMKPCLEKW